jgi:hypothetical protein
MAIVVIGTLKKFLSVFKRPPIRKVEWIFFSGGLHYLTREDRRLGRELEKKAKTKFFLNEQKYIFISKQS